MRASSWPLGSKESWLQQTNQEMVFLRPPEISEGTFQLRIDHWYYMVLKSYCSAMPGWNSMYMPLFLCCRSTKDTEVQVYYAYSAHFTYFTYFLFNVAHYGWICTSQQLSTSAVPVIQLKSRMSFQCHPYWAGFLLSRLPGANCDKTEYDSDGCRWR